MPYNPLEGFKIGQSVGQGKRSALGTTSDTLLDQFQKAGESNREIKKLKAVETFKNSLSSPKEAAETDLLKQKGNYFKQLTGGGGEGTPQMDEDFVVDRMGPNGPTYVNQKSRLALKTAGSVPVSQAMTGAEQMLRQIRDLKDLVRGGAKISGSLPFGGLSKEGQRYQLIKKDIGDRILRLRSGAQINEQEYQRLSGLMPLVTRADDVDLEQLDKFEQEFSTILQRLGGETPRADNAPDASRTSNPRELYNQLRSQGIAPDEAKRQAGL